MNLVFNYPSLAAIGSFVLALIGLALLEQGMFQSFAPRIDKKLRNLSPTLVAGWFQSVMISLMIFSTKRTQVRGLSGVQRGTLSLQQAGLVLSASYLPVLILLPLLLALYTTMAWPILATAALFYLFLRKTSFVGFALVLAGSGFIVLGTQGLVRAFSIFTTVETYYDFVFFTSDGRIFAVFTLLLSSLVVSLLPRTSFFSLVLALSGLTAGILSLAGAIALVLGEFLGIGVVVFLMSLWRHKEGVKWYSSAAVLYPVVFCLLFFMVFPGLSFYVMSAAAPLAAFLPAVPMGHLAAFCLWTFIFLLLMVMVGLIVAPLLQLIKLRLQLTRL